MKRLIPMRLTMDGIRTFNADDAVEVTGEDGAYYYADNGRIYSKMEEGVSFVIYDEKIDTD